MGGYGAPGFDWRNPFTAYNCTWGFHAPAPFPEEEDACEAPALEAAASALSSSSSTMSAGVLGAAPLAAASGVLLSERSNSTTCPRQMLCDYNTMPDGRPTKAITWCNIEGYNGMEDKWLGHTKSMLSKMPAGRCPYPPGDRPGMPGMTKYGHYEKTCPPLTWC